MSDYLKDDTSKREMPAKYVQAFEVWCGNTAISQWFALKAKFTVAEEAQAARYAA